MEFIQTNNNQQQLNYFQEPTTDLLLPPNLFDLNSKPICIDQPIITSSWYHHPFPPLPLQPNTNDQHQNQLPMIENVSFNDHSNLDPLLSNSTNSIDCWIDFTGGESSSGSTTTTTSFSPTESNQSTTNPIKTDPLIPSSLDHQHHPSISPQPKAHHFKRHSNLNKTNQQSSDSSPQSSYSPTSSSESSSNQPLSSSKNSNDKHQTKQNKKSSTTTANGQRRKKTEARNEFLERNRLAASRSRAKKKSYQQFLEDQATRLEAEQSRLKQIITDLINEKEQLKQLLELHHSS